MAELEEKECSAVLDKGCPRKKGDPGAFIVPCAVKDLTFDNALVDLGSSINVMPSFMFDRLIMPPLTPTGMTFRLADGSIRYPKGIVEDVLVRIKDFIIPVDFVVLDVGHDNLDVPLIFERPFLATCRAIIDVGMGKLTLRVENEEAKFGMTTDETHEHERKE
ncbi:PREDICTED: uncharacterized protein LOC109176714 [Ipomoea nil]|uniref:uncharacterized protein LOC109176714 n=1 Tax=Ipomoea nil TaxID=35883 RepID=UPI0009017071|nr:PREDICTED: uncharacterized protein LOC109176714 [Ipomoea nil]